MAKKGNPVAYRRNGVVCFMVESIGEQYECLVDESDYEALCIGETFHLVKGYAKCYDYSGGSTRGSYLHRMVLPGSPIIDHIDRNPLNNRRCNLRPASATENAANRSKRSNSARQYKGITKKESGFRAQIDAGGKRQYGPKRATEYEAHLDYVAMARQHYGEFATGLGE
jgi:hypothetical protein